MRRELTAGWLMVALAGVAAGDQPAPTNRPAGISASGPAARPAAVVINDRVRFQTIDGWDSHDWAGLYVESQTLGRRNEHPTWERWKNQFWDLCVDLGLNRVTIGGTKVEQTRDWFGEFLAGKITEKEMWRGAGANDNDDPSVLNEAGFVWTYYDFLVDRLVVPLRERLKARGETLWMTLNFSPPDAKTAIYNADPREYAEMRLAMYKHTKEKYGFVPDCMEIVNEPDMTFYTGHWEPDKIGRTIAATGAMLEANGFKPLFQFPCTTDPHNAKRYFDGALREPGIKPEWIYGVSYHRYGPPPTPQTLATLAELGKRYGHAHHGEMLGATYHTLHEDLKMVSATSWQKFGFGKYFDLPGPTSAKITLSEQGKFFRQYFKYVRRGAVRIDAESVDRALDPVAFINKDGCYVVVVKAAAASTFVVRNLPAGVYGVFYTTKSQYDVNSADQSAAQGEAVSASIPAAGVITIYDKRAGSRQSAPPKGPTSAD